MFLSEPGQTAYDLKFPFIGFPVRVHPAFFILPLVFGRNLIGDMNPGVGLLMVSVVFFVSILVHELGHAVAFRYYGIASRIVLYWMGGLAIPDQGSVWSTQRHQRSLNSNQQIVVSLAGPIFGFLLAGLLMLFVIAVGGKIVISDGVIPMPLPMLQKTIFAGNQPVILLIWCGILINVFLNLLNLVPIYPLDGGQVAREVMIKMDRQNGVRNSLMLSIGAAVLIALFALSIKDTFLAVFFGFMAYSNFQMLERYDRPRW